ncbi:putative P-loop containing nucleoside triphosphate hydrolase, leucine-rich repeat domain superfamily [Helianthus annuus]|uniref:P-loop containing nucleoside triphosphate hydrolase, leucine-rich repeat domain superfamily n=1 Tax=Helianthus annuus TaxID=4232 RepID=A0A9K3EM85_HELAN|nr:disease resistance protein RGA2-like [Helianthus annuus]KAF5775326.1 putative P-loop containing nucleoside triphosphate hydrolase, leucine-rich repeat domain superfamily [Helianthus annuus]
MSEIVLSAIFSMISDKLASAASASLEKLAPYNEIDPSEIEKLQRSLIQIQDLLLDASQKEITNRSVKLWLNDLQHLAYDTDDLLDDLATDAMHLSDEAETHTSKVRKILSSIPFSKRSSWTRSMKNKIDEITTRLQDLLGKKDDLGLIVKEATRTKNINRSLQTCVFDPSSIVGRQAEKEELVQRLLEVEPSDRNYSIVPIVGMGGVGKTTMARLLYDDQQVKDHFKLRAWVCVSDDFDSFGISKHIFKAVAPLVKEDFTDMNLLQVALQDQLKGKVFLLVLDDVWSERRDDWETLIRPFYTCAPGSKIIITSRKDILLKKLGYSTPNKQLGRLLYDDALSLFAVHALGVRNFDSHLSLKPHGEGIVKKCNGLPLALIALGTSLRTKEDEDSWKEVLESEIWKLPVEDEIIPALRLSYHDLSGPLKQLFAYCSLFPKDFLFDKEELVKLWMAEGFLHQPTLSDSTEEHLGHEFFDELLSRSFFQHAPNDESLFVMHDLMNDLATSVSVEFFLRLDNENEKNIRKEMLEKYRHMSFVREEYVTYKKFEAFERAKSLRTFLVTYVGEVESWRHFYLSQKILTDLLPEVPLLRVLSLSGFQISELPESIGTLRHLRYLNLSRTRITHLPETVCNLYNLQSLILSGCCEITKLPKSFLQLKNLRHLDVRDTPLLFEMLLEISRLKSLEITLSKINIECESGIEIAKLKDFKTLYEKISVVGLGKVQNTTYVHEANFSQKKLSELELVWSDALHDSRNEMLEKAVLNELKPCDDKLIQLQIWSYGGLAFPNWVGDPSFINLKHVSIMGCKRCTSLPPLGQLPSLKELFIKGLDRVEVVDFELFGTGRTFPSLEILSFKDMYGWKKWSGAVFPRLQKLEIKECRKLVEVTLEALPSLNDLDLGNCDSGVLRSLVEVASAVTKLRIRDISGLNDEVWGGVIESLGGVEELKMSVCNEIRYVVKSDADASKILVRLRKLEMWYCDNLVSVGEKEEEEEDNWRSNLLTSLRTLYVSYCKNMERCSCPDGIEELTVEGCSSMTVVSFPKGGQVKLRSLKIWNCRNLLEKEWEWGGQKTKNNRSSNMPMLEHVSIRDWPNLKSIIELNDFVHLTQLFIYHCERLESFPNNLTTLVKLEIENCPRLEVSFLGENLTSLEELSITNCLSMDSPFLSWVWPPNLCSLEIGKLKKPFSEWGPQTFPTSLVKLSLYGGRSCSEFSHLLHSSLTSLQIHRFEKLESFTMDLQHLQSLSFSNCANLKKASSHPQHLTSLHHLSFQDCPKMKDLPEMLLPSLLSLYIWGNCPGLKERCSKKGSYWPLISHIPYINIL